MAIRTFGNAAPQNPGDSFRPSKYQATIFNWIERGRGDAFVDAVAGSGKTTTLVQAAQLVRGRCLFLAFNKHIAEELGKRLPHTVACKTIHGLGFATVSRHLKNQGVKVEVQDIKLRKLARQWVIDARIYDPGSERASALVDVIEKCQMTLTDPMDHEAVDALMAHFDIDGKGENARWYSMAASSVLLQSEALAKEGIITYGDMLWLVHRWNLRPDTFDWVFVDEAQDLSAAQLHVATMARRLGGRMLFVGDRRQAIYGFAGADSRSVDTIIERTGAQELPLSICYRCPSSHLDMAREIVPQIEAREGAPVGETKTVYRSKLNQEIQEGDIVLCRITAPLVQLCWELIKERIPARIKGRDIGRQMVTIIRKASDFVEPSRTWVDGFLAGLDGWAQKELDFLRRKEGTETQQEAVLDKRDAISFMFGAVHPQNAGELESFIEELFADGRASVTLSTVHRAKGLETDRVWILKPDLLPFPKATGWQVEQEWNLKYVALTRAKKFLGFVVED